MHRNTMKRPRHRDLLPANVRFGNNARRRGVMRSLCAARIASAALLLTTSGCAGFLPRSGPVRGVIDNGASIHVQDLGPRGRLAYALVGLSPDVVAQVQSQDRPPLFSSVLTEMHRPATVKIGVGDVLDVTIFESREGGLFIPETAGARPGNFVQLPTEQVDQSGNISIPFGGTIKAVGETPIELERTINRRLANRALEPQAVVTVVDHRSSIVSVLGDVGTSARYALDPGGDRLLSAIARAGGPKFPAYESYVTVQRGGVTQRALLSEIADIPGQNIQLRGGDSVYVSHEQRYYLAMGAEGQAQTFGPLNRRFPFEDTKLSLADALAKAGGLTDALANPQAAFLYRFEPVSTLARIMGPAAVAGLPPIIPTVYTVNFARGDGFFLASQFPMHNHDLIYVSNAPSTDLAKFLSLIIPPASSAAGFRAGF